MQTDSVPMRAETSMLLRHVIISPSELLAFSMDSAIAASPRERDLRVAVLCGPRPVSCAPATGAFSEGGGQSVQG